MENLMDNVVIEKRMNDYCNGIAYASGYFASENGKRYLVVRNLDPWYVKSIEIESKYKAYESKHYIQRNGKPQWCIKARDINSIPHLSEIQCVNDFCRAYIEIHGVVDLATIKDRKGNHFKKPRLRVYGTEEVMLFLNSQLPANEKKIQYVRTDIGKTCALYYQSEKEIINILNWINGNPRNERIWNKWKEIIDVG